MIDDRSEDCEELTARFEEKSLARFDGFHFSLLKFEFVA